MGAGTIQQMADRVAGLMEERLKIRGSDLADKLRRGGRRLPARVRAAAETLAAAAFNARNPKLLVHIDEAQVAEAYDACVKHLKGVDAAARRKAMLMGIGSSIAFSLFTVIVLVLIVLWWRGFVG